MSDVMLFGVLKMPYEMVMASELSRIQFYQRVQELVARFEEQPEQEPVFKWCSVFQEMPTKDSHLLFCFGVHVVEGSYTKKGWASLAYGEAQPDFWAYMPPPPHHKRNQELYAMPPKRPWVGLTDEDRAEIAAQGHQRWKEYAQAIEAALRSKNT